jgi:peptidoglycan/xylan/chitin deacetylase (PgdA/CDA1 family)
MKGFPRPLALSVSVMLEGWTDDSAPGIGPMGNPLKAGVLDLQARSWAEYGPKVGAWRLLDILQRLDVRSVFYVSGLLAERYPELMKGIAQGGHAVAAHGWGQNIIPSYQSAEEEARDLGRCMTAIKAATSLPPAGWLSPRCTPSSRTSALLAKAGFDWHADFFDSDLPYRHRTTEGAIIAVPFTMEVNDMPLYVRYGAEPEAFTRIL